MCSALSVYWCVSELVPSFTMTSAIVVPLAVSTTMVAIAIAIPFVSFVPTTVIMFRIMLIVVFRTMFIIMTGRFAIMWVPFNRVVPRIAAVPDDWLTPYSPVSRIPRPIAMKVSVGISGIDHHFIAMVQIVPPIPGRQ